MSAPLRAFLVDDEVLALRQLASALRATGRVEIVGTARDPEAALGEIPALPVDALFLDIQMPGLNGFELLDRLPVSPLVVFVTGYNEYAVRAFETNAVDYLVKPIQRERLERTLDRLERLLGDPAREDVRALLERLAGYYLPARPAGFADRLAVDMGQQRRRVIEVARVTHFLAQDKGTLAVTATGRHLVERTLGELERLLDPRQFLRIHRATLVNLAWVAEVYADTGGRLLIRLKDAEGTTLEVARDRIRTVKERMGF